MSDEAKPQRNPALREDFKNSGGFSQLLIINRRRQVIRAFIWPSDNSRAKKRARISKVRIGTYLGQVEGALANWPERIMIATIAEAVIKNQINLA